MKIQKVSRYRFECSEDEIASLIHMLEFYRDYANDDSEDRLRLRMDFGVMPVEEDGDIEESAEREETLPEKAIRVSSGRKSRINKQA